MENILELLKKINDRLESIEADVSLIEKQLFMLLRNTFT
jgi:hypothetical protein